MLRVHIFGFAQQLQDLARAGRQSAVLRQALPFGSELVDLAGLEIQRLELAEVITQQLQPRFAILRGRGGAVALLTQLRPCTVLFGNRIEQLAMVAALIEQLALRGALHQRLIFHLAVDIDERFAELAQCLHGHRLAVHIRARASIGPDNSPQYALAFVLDRLLGKPGARGRVLRDREGGGDFRALSAMPHDFGAGAASRGEQQRIYEDGFAGAGLAGQHGQTGGKLQLGGVDDREIADLDMQQHAGVNPPIWSACTRSPRPQRSLERRMRK